MPRWVKVAGVVAAVLVLVFVALMVFGVGGDHGPGRHTSIGEVGIASARLVGPQVGA
jgi:hypothetical protein